MSEILKTLRRAGAIAREVRELGAKLIVPGASLREVCETVEAEIEKRRADWTAPLPRFTRGVLAKYARVVSSASRGAVTDPD